MKTRRLVAWGLALSLLSGGSTALAAGGSAQDPLISLDYLKGSFLTDLLQQTETKIKTACATQYERAKTRLDAQAKAYRERLNQAEATQGAWSYSNVFFSAAYSKGDKITLPAGCSALLSDGITVISAKNGEWIDLGDGASSTASMQMQARHRYLSGEKATVTISVKSDRAMLSLLGSYSVLRSNLNALPYTDLMDNAWYYQDVRYVVDAGLFQGVTEQTFAPNEPVSRAMMATILFRFAGEPKLPGVAGFFDDVPSGAWYEIPVRWSAARGVSKGVGPDLYGPMELLTREQMAVMLYRYVTEYLDREGKGTGDLNQYEDRAAVSSWAKDAVVWATGSGLLNGKTKTTLQPAGLATRAEVAALMNRFAAQYKP